MAGKTRAAVVVLALLLAAACASLDEGERLAADTLAEVVVPADASPAVEETADCVAERWVGEAGRERLAEDGLLTGKGEARPRNVRRTLTGARPVSERSARAYADAVLSCADYDTLALDERDGYPGATDEDLDEYADCLKEIDRDTRRQALVAELTGDAGGAAVRELAEVLSACRIQLVREASV